MDKIDHARKGRLMNIKENFYIYSYKRNSKLIDERNAEENKKFLFGIVVEYIDTPLQNSVSACKVLTNPHRHRTSVH
jgi:hypothetical protein